MILATSHFWEKVSELNFNTLHGVKINPQTVYKGVIDDSILIDAQIIEPMKGIRVTGGINFIYNPENKSEKNKKRRQPKKRRKK